MTKRISDKDLEKVSGGTGPIEDDGTHKGGGSSGGGRTEGSAPK